MSTWLNTIGSVCIGLILGIVLGYYVIGGGCNKPSSPSLPAHPDTTAHTDTAQQTVVLHDIPLHHHKPVSVAKDSSTIDIIIEPEAAFLDTTMGQVRMEMAYELPSMVYPLGIIRSLEFTYPVYRDSVWITKYVPVEIPVYYQTGIPLWVSGIFGLVMLALGIMI